MHKKILVWLTKEMKVSLSRYSAEDAISASFSFVYFAGNIPLILNEYKRSASTLSMPQERI